MDGGEISGNTSATDGGGIMLHEPDFYAQEMEPDDLYCSFTMNGGSICRNTADDAGGGVYFNDGFTRLSLSGSPTITDNAAKTGTENLYLFNFNTELHVRISGALEDGACVGVSVWNGPTAERPVVFTSGLTAQGNIGAFFSDKPAYIVDWSADGTEAALCRVPGAQERGDMDGDGDVDSDDAIYLLRYTLNPDRYPIEQDGDVDGDGDADSDDAIYLLRYTLNPDKYPLH